MIRLDQIDLRILRVLAGNARITKSELAKRVGLSASPAWERMHRLEKAGIIERYEARISLRALAPHVMVFVAVELEAHTSAHFHRFEHAVKEIDEVTACWALGGGYDYILQIVTRDIDRYQRLIDDLLEARIGLARYFTYIVTKPIKSAGPPIEALVENQKD